MTQQNQKKMSPLEELRHSCAHVMASAVLRLFPEAQIDIGPPTDNGFYYDFHLAHKFTTEDLSNIEQEMAKIIAENQTFQCQEVSREYAKNFFEKKGQIYKLSRLDDIPNEQTITFYTNGEFTDLCAGTHIPTTGKIKAFKLLSIAGAYYRGNENNIQMQRIYGTAFPSKKELQLYLHRIEEAKKRDHRKIGKEMNLFLIDEQVGSGLILWAPKGATLRKELQAFISTELNRQGYDEVFTPHIAKLELFRTSGHYPYYKDSQFPPILEPGTLQKENDICCLQENLEKGNIDGYLLKPMNCPMHIKIYDSIPRSYKDLPVRIAEFGTVHRWEQSGELNGMTRVRGFTQDDAHIFCTEDQLGQEINGCLHLVKTILNTLGMQNYNIRLSLRDPDSSKYIGKPEQWDKAETALRTAVQSLNVPFNEEPGEAAFYGPKIDFVVHDVIGREWQLGTIQVDYNLPERFNISYTGKDNLPHRPVMIHRAPFGSMERFTGVLIEHFAGNFPTWLAPEQVRILPINDSLLPYANNILQQLQALHIRASIDAHSDKLGNKIRRAEIEKIPHMLILGEKEKQTQQASVRSRIRKNLNGTHSIDTILSLLKEEINNKCLPDTFSQD